MGMHTRVQGYIHPDNEIHKKHTKVLEVCKEAGVSLPRETSSYFDDMIPDFLDSDAPLEVSIPFHKVSSGDMIEGYEVVLSELPAGIHKIRFTNFW